MIVTKKLYELPDMLPYETDKNNALNLLAEHYANLTPAQRWPILMKQFLQVLPAALPIEQRTEFVDILDNVIKADNNIKNGRATELYNLTLEKYLNYFENFYFLYTTDLRDYKLTAYQKQSLLV